MYLKKIRFQYSISNWKQTLIHVVTKKKQIIQSLNNEITFLSGNKIIRGIGIKIFSFLLF